MVDLLEEGRKRNKKVAGQLSLPPSLPLSLMQNHPNSVERSDEEDERANSRRSRLETHRTVNLLHLLPLPPLAPPTSSSSFSSRSTSLTLRSSPSLLPEMLPLPLRSILLVFTIVLLLSCAPPLPLVRSEESVELVLVLDSGQEKVSFSSISSEFDMVFGSGD